MKMMLCLLISFFSCVCLHAQVKGRLLSAADDQPVEGATVSLRHAKAKTLTGANGEFSLPQLTAPDTLIISHTGFSVLFIPVGPGSKTTLLLTLNPSTKQLEEVVVNTGYQSIPKERATGSFEKIDNARFNEQGGTTVMARLEAIAGAVYYEKKTYTTPTVVVRGLSTISGQKAPLIVLDNFPYEGTLDNINPNDVESITILKDAAAASIWGTRAGNGVIVITTKKGKFNQPLHIEVNNSVMVTQKPDLSYFNVINSSDFIDLEQFLYSKGYYNSMITSTSRPTLSPVVEILVKKANGSLSAAQADAQINALRGHDVRNDFNDYLYNTSVNHQHSLSLRGGSNIMAWDFSAGLDQNSSNLDAIYDRINIKADDQIKLSKRIALSTGLYLTQATSKDGKPGYGDVSTTNGNLPPYERLADSTGKALPVIKTYRQAYLDTAGAGKLFDWNYYPLTDYTHVHNTTVSTEILATLGINVKIYRDLSIDLKYEYERQSSVTHNLSDIQSYAARNLINLFSQLNRTTGVVTYKVPRGGILTNSTTLIEAQNGRGQINYNHHWHRFEINAITGSEIREVRTTGNSFIAYGYNPDILTYGTADLANTYPTFITGGSSMIGNGISFTDKLNRFVSFYGNTALTYDQKYTVSASAKRDASNLFGVNTNDKWSPLWSSGFAWDLYRERFYHSGFVPKLKLRLTYGVSGTADPTRSAVTTILYGAVSPFTGVPYAPISQYGNPGLRWEKVYMFNMGVDFVLKQDRVQGSIEYYHKKAVDLFGPTPVDYTAVATTTTTRNVASFKANGYDININSVNIPGKISWTTDMNFSFNADKITSYYKDKGIATLDAAANGTSVSAFPGAPIFAFYAFRWAGLDPVTGDPQGYLNGKVTKDYNALSTDNNLSDLKYIGPARPTVFGNMGNTVNWKQFSLTARISYKFGYYFKRTGLGYTSLYAGRIGNNDYALRWQKPGDEAFTNVPSLVYPANSSRDNFYNATEIFFDKADNIRLEYVTLAYTVRKRPGQHLPFSGMQVSLNANNLGIIWKATKWGIDPDYKETTLPPSKNIVATVKFDW